MEWDQSQEECQTWASSQLMVQAKYYVNAVLEFKSKADTHT